MANDDFSVTLLDTPKVEATAFPRSGAEGLAISIKAVPEGWVRPASTHIAIARVLNPANDSLWRWFDVNNEAAHVRAEKDYDIAKNGQTPYVLIVNGQTFSRDPDAMLSYVRGKGALDGRQNVGLVDHSIPLGKGYADKVLGEHVVWAFKEGRIQEIAVPFFTVDQYIEAQKDGNFLQQNPTFICLFTEEQAQQYRHNDCLKLRNEQGTFSPDKRLTEHVPSHMQAGTKDIWGKLLEVAAEVREYDTFYAGMPKLAEDSGRVGFVYYDLGGFGFGDADGGGCSLGVSAGGALDALVSQYTALREPSIRLQRDIVQATLAISAGSLKEGLEQVLPTIFAKYAPIKDK